MFPKMHPTLDLQLQTSYVRIDTKPRTETSHHDSDDYLTEILILWLHKNYNTEIFGEPSWELLAKAVGHPTGGNDSALAELIICKMYFSRDQWTVKNRSILYL